MNKRICVYCSSSDIIEEKYREAAESFARAASLCGYTVVCGGSSKGLMGVIIETMITEGAAIEGVMPEFMKKLEFHHEKLKKMSFVKTMSDRKELLRFDTDAVVALPGGLGTLEEFVETFTLKRLGLYPGAVILLNMDGFYDPFIKLLDHFVEHNFLNENYSDGLIVVKDIDELINIIGSNERVYLEPRHYSPTCKNGHKQY